MSSARGRRPGFYLERVRVRRIVGLWYDEDDGFLRVALDDGSVLHVSACGEGVHVVVAIRTKRQSVPSLCHANDN